MSLFDDTMANATGDLFSIFGSASTIQQVPASGEAVTLSSAVFDQTVASEYDFIDDDGQTVEAAALLTVPASVDLDIISDRITVDGVRWSIAGVVSRNANLIVYAMTQSSHVTLKTIRLKRRKPSR